LEYSADGLTHFCEVKTVGVSDEEVERRRIPTRFSPSGYKHLTAKFLTKLQSTLDLASSQIHARGSGGLIYVVFIPDDFTLEHYSTYRQQLQHCIDRHPERNIFIKVGLNGQRRVEKPQGRVAAHGA
jgi:hypothetical protein